jgi:hypothetical protein
MMASPRGLHESPRQKFKRAAVLRANAATIMPTKNIRYPSKPCVELRTRRMHNPSPRDDMQTFSVSAGLKILDYSCRSWATGNAL